MWIAFGNNGNKMARDLPNEWGEAEGHLKTQTPAGRKESLPFPGTLF